jgi:hypothetical protein
MWVCSDHRRRRRYALVDAAMDEEGARLDRVFALD